jgi:hypothetical protein
MRIENYIIYFVYNCLINNNHVKDRIKIMMNNSLKESVLFIQANLFY